MSFSTKSFSSTVKLEIDPDVFESHKNYSGVFVQEERCFVVIHVHNNTMLTVLSIAFPHLRTPTSSFCYFAQLCPS